jgi:hypothetical protein
LINNVKAVDTHTSKDRLIATHIPKHRTVTSNVFKRLYRGFVI